MRSVHAKFEAINPHRERGEIGMQAGDLLVKIRDFDLKPTDALGERV
ncbi:MAG TPA: hypothetical protein VJR47_12250 [Stellaceae bacterium]|nr:hypothetical protein [Stellaceae bacterium]